MSDSRQLFARLFLAGTILLAVPTRSWGEIVRFREIENGRIYRGGQPETLEDFAFLQKTGIRTIINFKTTREEIARESRISEALGIRMISHPISPIFGVSDEEIDQIQSLMRDRDLQPVFIHCSHGKDRTGLMAGIYRVEQQGWTPEAAYAEMRSLGFSPWLVALRHRFWDRMSHQGFAFLPTFHPSS